MSRDICSSLRTIFIDLVKSYCIPPHRPIYPHALALCTISCEDSTRRVQASNLTIIEGEAPSARRAHQPAFLGILARLRETVAGPESHLLPELPRRPRLVVLSVMDHSHLSETALWNTAFHCVTAALGGGEKENWRGKIVHMQTGKKKTSGKSHRTSLVGKQLLYRAAWWKIEETGSEISRLSEIYIAKPRRLSFELGTVRYGQVYMCRSGSYGNELLYGLSSEK